MSRLEDMVASAIEETYPAVKMWRNARIIKKTKKSRYEIDIYLEELKLGFEVQDFTTHSRDSDVETGNPWKKYKKGPKLHELKRDLAMKQLGVTIVELWEDDILSEAFLATIDHEISSRLFANEV